jgi:hypothetical protein
MDDLNGREDTPKTCPLPIGINHISPNEQRSFGPFADDSQAGSFRPREQRAAGDPVDRPIPRIAPRNSAVGAAREASLIDDEIRART